MKRLLIMFLSAVFTFTLYAYETVPLKFNNLVPYGISPDKVNEILVSSNFISQAVDAVSGTFYRSMYPDPDLVWYNIDTMNWINITFTTNDVSQIFMRDNTILYFAYTFPNEFKCIIIRGSDLNDDVSEAGKDTKWAYKFFFHNDKLFAISSRYEGNYTLKQYQERNPGKEYANPGFIMSSGLFERTLKGFQNKYGGFQNTKVITLNPFASMIYGNYSYGAARITLSLYYGTYMGKYINFVASYIDNYEMLPIARRFQNKVYENYFDVSDIPVGISTNVRVTNNTAETNN